MNRFYTLILLCFLASCDMNTVSLPTFSVTFLTKILASDGSTDDDFGNSVSLSSDGTIALVGAQTDNETGLDSGSAYIYTHNGTSWTQSAKLIASDGIEDARFGCSVSLSSDGKIALIGAFVRNKSTPGSAYVFIRNGTKWSQAAKLTASDGVDGDYFGRSVSLSSNGNTALVGTSHQSKSSSGAAYVFTRSGTSWSQTSKLTTTVEIEGDLFGHSVNLSSDGNTAIISALNDDEKGKRAGAAYIFTNNGTSWSQTAKLTASDGGAYDYFGLSLSLSYDGAIALIGAYDYSGSAYIFTQNETEWSQTAKLTASDRIKNSFFGISSSLSTDGTIALIGAGLEEIGSAYMFTSSSWRNSNETAKLIPSDGEKYDNFGNSVTISSDGTTVLIGAPSSDGNERNSGSVYSYFIGE